MAPTIWVLSVESAKTVDTVVLDVGEIVNCIWELLLKSPHLPATAFPPFLVMIAPSPIVL